MILRVNYEINGKEKIAEIKNRRIITSKDREEIEKMIERKYGYERVLLTNWKIIGSKADKIGGEIRNGRNGRN